TSRTAGSASTTGLAPRPSPTTPSWAAPVRAVAGRRRRRWPPSAWAAKAARVAPAAKAAPAARAAPAAPVARAAPLAPAVTAGRQARAAPLATAAAAATVAMVATEATAETARAEALPHGAAFRRDGLRPSLFHWPGPLPLFRPHVRMMTFSPKLC